MEIQRQNLLFQVKSIEEDLKSLPAVSDAIVYDYNEDTFFLTMSTVYKFF